MELTYTKAGDYYIPDLVLDDDTEYEIGIYGRMRQRFLEEYHPGTYSRMLLFGELWKHLAEIDAACRGSPDLGHGEAGRRDRSPESLRPNGMGGTDEQYPQPG